MAGIDFIHQNGVDYEIVPEIAPLFKTTVAYHTGDHVIYEAGWYTFKADKSAGAWDATKVDGPFKVTNQISELKEELTVKTNILNFDSAITLDCPIDGVGYVAFADGTVTSSSNYNHTDYIDVRGYGAISYKRPKNTNNTSAVGSVVFYDKSKNFISGVACGYSNALGYESELYTVIKPANAVYARFSLLADTATYGDFSALGISKLYILSADNDLKTEVDAVVELIKPTNLINFADDDFVTGSYILPQSGSLSANSSYNTTGFIPIEGGKTYTYAYGSPVGSSKQMRFIAFYDAYKGVLSAEGKQSVASFVAPQNAKYVRFSAVNTYLKSDNAATVVFFEGTTIDAYSAYFAPYFKIKNTAISESYINGLISAQISTVVTEYGTAVSAKTAELASNTQFTVVENIDNKKNSVIEFIGYFESFASLILGHGYNVGYGNYIVVDDTHITVYGDSTPTQLAQVSHGLTISDFLHVTITQNDGGRAKIQIMSVGGDYSINDVGWSGCKGSVFAISGGAMTDVIATAVFKDFNSGIFIFGDSYMSIGDPQRIPYHLIQAGYTEEYIDGYGGRNSASALISFNNVIAKAKPKCAIWAMGMNDADSSSAINSSWKTCVESFIATCEQYSITPILCTIPNCPEVRHTYKNAYVKASGKRYVDFAKAVGAEEAASSWYTGMLYTDNVHPTQLGAKALYRRLITDVPELLK